MTEKMDFLELWKLQLIFRFTRDESPLEYRRNDIAIAEDEGQASPLRAVLAQIKTCRIFKKLIFDVYSDNHSIKISKRKNINHDYINGYLRRYCKNLEENTIKDPSGRIELNSYNAQYNEFLNSIDHNLNLNDYKIKAEYLPVILVGYFNGLVKINQYEVNLPLKRDYGYDNINVIEDFYNEDFDTPVLVQDFMSMNCKVDISKFVSIPTKIVKNKVIKSKNNSFTKSEKFLIGLAKQRLINANEVIRLEDIEEIYSKKGKNSKTPLNIRTSNNVSKINNKFNKITGKILLKLQDGAILVDTYDIIATIEDINIALNFPNN